jgi:hypothetical protein
VKEKEDHEEKLALLVQWVKLDLLEPRDKKEKRDFKEKEVLTGFKGLKVSREFRALQEKVDNKEYRVLEENRALLDLQA